MNLNPESKHHRRPRHKRKTEKAALANKTNYTLVWYAFYDLLPGNEVGSILTAVEPAWGKQ